MLRFNVPTLCLLAALAVSLPASIAGAHCQVPCGIYGDQNRFEEMLEDATTIAKAQAQANEIFGRINSGAFTLADLNQHPRWVANKESHAQNIQDIIGEYFLAQRIKADKPRYTEQLVAAHGVIVAAMKCKQSGDPATAETLKASILALYTAYEGKAPAFGAIHRHAPAVKVAKAR